MSDVYEVKAHHPEHGHVIARVEADNEREARKLAKAEIYVRKLSAREVSDLTAAGKAITWKEPAAAAEGQQA
jgi:hypothetical protein